MVKLFKILLLISIGVGLFYFCEQKTQGFRLYTILSNLPNDPRWEADPLSEEEMADIQKRLDQPFTFLGRGGWCYAFLGADQKTVLKFYKHEHLCLSHIVKDFHFGKLFLKSPLLKENSSYFQEFNFTSCMLLYRKAKERTGLIYVHLNKTKDLHPTVTLYDPLGVRHTVCLDETEFVLQEKAEPLFTHLDRLVDGNDLPRAKQAIDAMLNCLLELSQKGIKDLDQKLYENFGYIGNQAVTFDLSSFVESEQIRRPAVYKKELIYKTLRLNRWLKKHHPELHIYCEERINAIIDSQ